MNYNLLLSSALFQSPVFLLFRKEISRLAFIAPLSIWHGVCAGCSAPAATLSEPSALVTTHFSWPWATWSLSSCSPVEHKAGPEQINVLSRQFSLSTSVSCLRDEDEKDVVGRVGFWCGFFDAVGLFYFPFTLAFWQSREADISRLGWFLSPVEWAGGQHHRRNPTCKEPRKLDFRGREVFLDRILDSLQITLCIC